MSFHPINQQGSQQQTEASFFPETVLEGHVDSDFVIYGFANSFAVPQWVPEKKQKTCNHCKDTLKSNATHNCRLCGNVFCSHCTGKYNLPEKYEQKSKQGPTRVCYGCKMSCIRMRQAALNVPLDSIQRMLPPPHWQDPKTYIACNKCCVKRRNPHNCRLCGNLHCDDCSTKMALNFPPAFNLKKKMGPQRVCDSCRYRIIAGARLDDGTQQQIQTFLRQQSQQQSQQQLLGTPTSPTLNGMIIEPLVLTNDLQSPRYQTKNVNYGASPIRIVHNGNIQTIPTMPVSTSSPQTPLRGSISQNDPDLTQITSSLHSLSMDSQSEGVSTPRDGNNGIKFQYTHGNQANNGQYTPRTRAQRYQAALNSQQQHQQHRLSIDNGSRGSTSTTSQPTPIQEPSASTTPLLQQLQPTSEQLLNIMGGSGQPKKRPAGARDIYRALSTVQPSHLPQNQRKVFQQTLDDQKEGDLDEDIPPPPPLPPGEIERSALVKPSELFNRLKNQNNGTTTNTNQPQPGYLNDENIIQPGR